MSYKHIMVMVLLTTAFFPQLILAIRSIAPSPENIPEDIAKALDDIIESCQYVYLHYLLYHKDRYLDC